MPSLLSRRAWLVLPVLLLMACTGARRDLFGPRSPARDRAAETLHVRFEVSCDRCAIRWHVGFEGGSVRDSGVWSHRARVTVFEGESTLARLSASPVPGSGPVSRVRIYVNGRKVAEASTAPADEGTGGELLGTLSVQSPVPAPERDRIVAGPTTASSR